MNIKRRDKLIRQKDSIFDTPYIIQSASPSNTINLELPLGPLQRALRSATSATSASLRLTKKDNAPLLSLTIVTNTINSGNSAASFLGHGGGLQGDNEEVDEPAFGFGGRDRETIVTQDIPVRVLSAAQVEGIHEPRCKDPDVHILLPSLLQLKNISERFTKLATTADKTASASGGGSLLASANTPSPRLELAATMHGSLRLSFATNALNISSVWTGLSNPELDPSQVEGGEEGLREHPSTIMKGRDSSSEDAWAKVMIDGKDWGRVLSVGRLGGRVIACESQLLLAQIQ